MDVKYDMGNIQDIINFITQSYSQEEIFSLGRNIGVDKTKYYGFGMNNSQLSEAFVSRVQQENKIYELENLIINNDMFKRTNISKVIEDNNSKSILKSLHAIVIGVNNYSKVDYFNSLSFSSKDAQDIYNMLVNVWNVPERNIALFNTDDNTISEKIYLKINEYIDKLSESDNLLIYFSGHGDEINGKSYLILSDTCENCEEGKYDNAISLKKLNERLKQCKANLKIRIFDACKCGESFSKGNQSKKKLTEKFKIDLLGDGKGWITLLSCNSNECSYEDGYLHNGVFTYYIIEGIKGQARRGNSTMMIEDLKIFVCDKVPKRNSDQNPQYHCEVQGNVYIE